MNNLSLNDVRFYDYQPKAEDFFYEISNGLNKKPKAISPKFFYDAEGSRLFDVICKLPEYYPTRTEITLLKKHAPEIADYIGAGCLLVEPGSGNSQKVRLLLNAIKPHAYLPMEISKEHLLLSAESLMTDFPWLNIYATCTDFTDSLDLPYCPPGIRKVAFFPGSTIGNFEPLDAASFLKRIADMIGPGGGLLIGVDLKKDHKILTQAYNDTQGVTAAFNLNLLKRINRELDADFDLAAFQHYAFYNEVKGRIEMHLISQKKQTVSIRGQQFEFLAEESIHTENSYKYSPNEFQLLAKQAGFHAKKVWMDEKQLFSVHYFAVAR